MKKIIFTILIIIMNIMTTNADNVLTQRQLSLCECASLLAQGDILRLETAINKALDNGVEVNELKEAFSQLYAYAGFPRSLNGLNALNRVLNDRKSRGIPVKEGKPFSRPAVWNNPELSLEQGRKIQTLINSGVSFDYDFCPQDDYYLKSHLFGDIFAGNTLSMADRELVTVAALSSIKGVEPQLSAHKKGAVNVGNSQAEVEYLCRWLSDNGLSVTDNSSDSQFGVWSKGDFNKDYAQYFSGDSFVSPVKPANSEDAEQSVVSYVNVTFEPGCRNNWHIHHGMHQILICVTGEGWYQEWGKEPIELLPGMIIDIPDGVKHWHGAKKNSWFQHLTTHVSADKDMSNEWLEPVTEDQYPE